jgi:hypothetical protein
MNKLLIILLLLFQSTISITKKSITIDQVKYIILEKKILERDTLYYCTDNVVFRKHDDILYYYKKGEYKKYKL